MMSAEALGGNLLRDVTEESLDVLLRSLREQASSTTSQIGVPVIDRFLEVFQVPATARAQHQQVQYTQWSTAAAAPDPPPAKEKRLPAIEITGVSACSGKTQLLYHIIAVTLLPSLHHDVLLRGKNQAVVLFDLSSSFSVLRLRELMRGYIADKSSSSACPLSEEEITLLILASLTHLHVFRPESTLNLITTLSSLPTYLLARPSSHFSANRSLGLLAINDISAFYQQDRLESEEAQLTLPTIDRNATTNTTTTTTNKTSSSITLLQTHYTSLTTTLQAIQTLFSPPTTTVIATNTALTSPTSSTSTSTSTSPPTTTATGVHPSLRPHLPAIWNNYITLPLLVSRDRVTKFSPGMSVEEASAERGMRWEAVSRSGFSGWVNWWGSGGWREEVREGLRKVEGGGRFRFWVGGGGEGGVIVGDGDGRGGGDGGGDEEGKGEEGKEEGLV